MDRHPAVAAALDLIPNLIAVGPVGTGELAARVGISASRLTHLITTEVGDLTTAAHAAGFADSAHLTRTCWENFGLPPSALSRNISWHR